MPGDYGWILAVQGGCGVCAHSLSVFFLASPSWRALSVSASHVSAASPKGPGVIVFGLTKAGKRQGAAESVTIRLEDVCRRLYRWKAAVSPRTSLTPSSYGWRKMFNDMLKAVGFDQVDYLPYSLRRGGATIFFTVTRVL